MLRQIWEILCLLILEKGIIENMSTGKKFEIKPFDQFMLDILNDGGLVKHHLKSKE